TERDLVVTRSQLVAVYTREPQADQWADQTAVATGQTAGTFNPFLGDQPIVHRLYVSHPLFGLPEVKTVTLQIGLAIKSPPWPKTVDWKFWNGTEWAAPSYSFSDDLQLTFQAPSSQAPGFAAIPVNGIDGFWLCGQLKEPLAPGKDGPQVSSLQVQV